MKRVLCAAAVALAMGVAPASWAETKLFNTADLVGGELSGTSAAVSGTTAVLGAPGEDSGTGAAYVFVKIAGFWVFQQRLAPLDAPANAGFGAAISIHGDDIAVGAPGRNSGQGGVYTFTRTGAVWTQDVAVLQADIPQAGAQFGHSVSIESATLAIGAPFENRGTNLQQGATYAFAKQLDNTWSDAANSGGAHLVERRGNSRAGDNIGFAVALSGNTILSGAPGDDFGNKQNRGSVWVYARNGGVWATQGQRLSPGGTAGDQNGYSVAVFSNGAVVGAPGRTSNRGGATTYSRATALDPFGSAANITAGDAAAGDRFGTSVAVSGPLKLIGAPQAAGTGNGKSYLFGSTNNFIGNLTASDNAAGDNFGTSVSIDSGRGLVGAPGQDPDAKSNAGAGYLFDDLVTSTTTAIVTVNGCLQVDPLPDPCPSNAGDAYVVAVKVTPSPIAPRIVDVNDGDGAICSPSITLDANGEGSCSLTSIAPGPHQISAFFTGNDTFSASTGTANHDVLGGDLAVSKSDGGEGVVPGSTVTYTIVVSNPGDFNAVGVEVKDAVDAADPNDNLALSNASWSCTAQVGGTCPNPASGTGDLDQFVDLLAGGQVTFTFTADVAANLVIGTSFVDNTVTIVPGANTDLNTNNNTATDTDDVVSDDLFSDSFEDPPI